MSMDTKPWIVNMQGIVKRYYIGQPNELQILNGIDFQVAPGEMVAIVGESGSGKSTLMNLIGLLDLPTEGQYFFKETDMGSCNDNQRSELRNRQIGFVFQNFNLLARTSALENVELPLLYAGVGRKERRERAMELLRMVDMEDRASHKPNEMSGGQQQRVAIARAMANNPDLLLADEPTGALDTKSGHMVMDLFHRLHEEQGKTVILVTHNTELARETQREVVMRDGSLIAEDAGGAEECP
jgi:putative ABC transport system ATP-binding protein